MDIGGSMDDHVKEVERLFTAARYEFKHLEYYYFHNCLYEKVWKNSSMRWSESTPTMEVFNTYSSDYKVIVVGDASMSPYELHASGGSIEHLNDEPGKVWLKRLRERYPHNVWMNPVPKEYWEYTRTIGDIKNTFDNRMFPLTLEGISLAVAALKKGKKGGKTGD